jgi:hypothetical protein
MPAQFPHGPSSPAGLIDPVSTAGASASATAASAPARTALAARQAADRESSPAPASERLAARYISKTPPESILVPPSRPITSPREHQPSGKFSLHFPLTFGNNNGFPPISAAQTPHFAPASSQNSDGIYRSDTDGQPSALGVVASAGGSTGGGGAAAAGHVGKPGADEPDGAGGVGDGGRTAAGGAYRPGIRPPVIDMEKADAGARLAADMRAVAVPSTICGACLGRGTPMLVPMGRCRFCQGTGSVPWEPAR